MMRCAVLHDVCLGISVKPKQKSIDFIVKPNHHILFFSFPEKHWFLSQAEEIDSDNLLDPMEMKVKELLKEFQLDYSPALHKLVESTVSDIKKAIELIPDDLKVVFLSIHYLNVKR